MRASLQTSFDSPISTSPFSPQAQLYGGEVSQPLLTPFIQIQILVSEKEATMCTQVSNGTDTDGPVQKGM